MNNIADGIEKQKTFIYQNILSSHFNTLSLRAINERLKNTSTYFTIIVDTFICIILTRWGSFPLPYYQLCILLSGKKAGGLLLRIRESFYNNVHAQARTQARLFLFFLKDLLHTHFIIHIGQPPYPITTFVCNMKIKKSTFSEVKMPEMRILQLILLSHNELIINYQLFLMWI